MSEDIKQIRIGNIYGADKGSSFAGNVWDKNGLCPCITTCGGGNRQPLVIEYERRENNPD